MGGHTVDTAGLWLWLPGRHIAGGLSSLLPLLPPSALPGPSAGTESVDGEQAKASRGPFSQPLLHSGPCW